MALQIHNKHIITYAHNLTNEDSKYCSTLNKGGSIHLKQDWHSSKSPVLTTVELPGRELKGKEGSTPISNPTRKGTHAKH